MILLTLAVALALAVLVWSTEALARALHTAGTALLARHCRDQWAEQSARVICARRVDFLNDPIPSWW